MKVKLLKKSELNLQYSDFQYKLRLLISNFFQEKNYYPSLIEIISNTKNLSSLKL